MKSETQKIIYVRLRTALEARLARAFDIDPKELPGLPLCDIISLLFALFGDTNSMGGCGSTAGAIIALIGRELFWETPKPEHPASTAVN
jgi:hypothetical protein